MKRLFGILLVIILASAFYCGAAETDTVKVEKIELSDGTAIDVDGIFILRPSIAPTTLFSGLEIDGAHIVVDKNQETNYKGCYAAGDCTGRPYQITKAVGEGNIAAHAILERLGEMDKE